MFTMMGIDLTMKSQFIVQSYHPPSTTITVTNLILLNHLVNFAFLDFTDNLVYYIYLILLIFIFKYFNFSK